MKNKGKKRILKLTMLCLCLLLGRTMIPARTVVAASQKKGWVSKSGNRYYYKAGEKLLGFQKIGKYKYYFELTNGAMQKDTWKKINNHHYYFMSNGQLAKRQWIGSYYVNINGARVKNKWIGDRFVGENGKWIKNFKGGWQKIDSDWYYYTSKGQKKTGWIKYKGHRYYLDDSGRRVTKLQTINQKKYYFSSKGILKSSGWVKTGGWYYYVDSTGRLLTKERMNKSTRAAATAIEYHTDTLDISLKKVHKYSTDYWTAHVKIKNIRQLRSALSHGTYGGARQTTSSALKSNKAIIGINGSAFSYSTGAPGFDAVMIKDGAIFNKAGGTSYSLMAINWEGTMYTPAQGLSAAKLLQENVKDTFNFGPVLLQNGVTIPFSSQGNPFSLMNYKDPRTGIGMIKPGEYVLLVADGRGKNGSLGLTGNEMIQIFRGFGCQYAYNLDGGGSATLAYNGSVLNNPSDGAERPCGDFLLFTK